MQGHALSNWTVSVRNGKKYINVLHGRDNRYCGCYHRSQNHFLPIRAVCAGRKKCSEYHRAIKAELHIPVLQRGAKNNIRAETEALYRLAIL